MNHNENSLMQGIVIGTKIQRRITRIGGSEYLPCSWSHPMTVMALEWTSLINVMVSLLEETGTSHTVSLSLGDNLYRIAQ
jgi:hypothetical protein